MSNNRVNTIKPNQQDHKCPWGISEKFSVEQQQSLQGSNFTWSRDFGGASRANPLVWRPIEASVTLGGEPHGEEPLMLLPCSAILPPHRQQTAPCSQVPHLDPSKMPVYGDDFYGPGLSAIYLSPCRYFPCTFLLFCFPQASPSVFHYFSSTPVFPI